MFCEQKKKKKSPYAFAGCHFATTDHSFISLIHSTSCGEVYGNSEVSHKNGRRIFKGR